MNVRLFDGHCDTAFSIWCRKESLKSNTGHIDLQKAAGLSADAQFFAFCSLAGTEEAEKPLLEEPLRKLRAEVKANEDRIGFAQSADEVLSLNRQGKTAALLSLEGAELIGCDPDRLPALREQGFRMLTLTWNSDNALAGCHLGQAGLTSARRDFVREAQKLGIYVDVSHLGEKSFWDLADLTEQPIIASHSNARAVWDVSRNLTDDQLRFIGQSGGTAGLNLYTDFLGEHADFETLLRHLEHMLTICGETHVALGGDLDGCESLPKGFQNVGSYADFYVYLKNRGYSEDLLDRIFYQNLLNLF